MKIYLAGFGVFRPDAVKYGEELKAICQSYGHEGLYPLDNQCDSAKEIYEGNIELIKKADAVIADVNPFRGMEPDSGTAFEIGYATALGKTVICYLSDGRDLKEKITDDFYSVEDFSLPVNLMIGIGARVVEGDFKDALKSLDKIRQNIID